MLREPLFDEHGYPAEETLEAIEKWPYKDGFVELMEFVAKAWNEDYGKVNFVFWGLCWMKSERGGYFEFEVEKKPSRQE